MRSFRGRVGGPGVRTGVAVAARLRFNKAIDGSFDRAPRARRRSSVCELTRAQNRTNNFGLREGRCERCYCWRRRHLAATDSSCRPRSSARSAENRAASHRSSPRRQDAFLRNSCRRRPPSRICRRSARRHARRSLKRGRCTALHRRRHRRARHRRRSASRARARSPTSTRRALEFPRSPARRSRRRRGPPHRSARRGGRGRRSRSTASTGAPTRSPRPRRTTRSCSRCNGTSASARRARSTR